MIDATRQMGHAGHRRRLLAARPGRGRPRRRRAPTTPRPTAARSARRSTSRRRSIRSASTIAVNRADGVTRAMVAPTPAAASSPARARSSTLGADMDPITAPRAFQFVELGETGAGTAGGSRASAHVLFRNALREAAELRRFAPPISGGAAAAGRSASDPVVRNPNESRVYGPRRPAQRGRAADPLRRRGAGAGAPGPPISAGPCRAGERHPPGARAQARVPVAQAGAGRRHRGLDRRRPDRRGRSPGDRLGR